MACEVVVKLFQDSDRLGGPSVGVPETSGLSFERCSISDSRITKTDLRQSEDEKCASGDQNWGAGLKNRTCECRERESSIGNDVLL